MTLPQGVYTVREERKMKKKSDDTAAAVADSAGETGMMNPNQEHPYHYDENDEDEKITKHRQEWINLNSFAARLLGAGGVAAAAVPLEKPIWMLREALEDMHPACIAH